MDNGSIFTKNLINFLEKKNFLFEKQVPENLNLDEIDKYDSFILSGRRFNSKKTNEINSKIVKYCIKKNKKLLGICYGAEILALTLGGTIKKIPISQKGIQQIEIVKDNFISRGSIEVYQSHGFEISKLSQDFVHLAHSENCKYEIIQYKDKFIFGTQFHPEMSDDGQKLLEKFYFL